VDEKTLARFWSKVDKSGPVPSHVPEIGNCWKWRAVNKWYGHFSVEKVRYYSHRLSWEIANGAIPTGMLVLHKCDNPECVRPEHLFIGTHLENALDKIRKGRANSPSGDAHQFRKHPEIYGPILSKRNIEHGLVRNLGEVRRGSKSGQSKLSEPDIAEIHRLRLSGIGPRKIAESFGVSRSLIQQILRGDQWRHVTRERFVNPLREKQSQARKLSSHRSDSQAK